MPHFGAISRANLVRVLRQAGFVGPFAGGKHQYMERGTQRVRIPNPHQSDIGVNLVSRILEQAGISREEWEKL